MTTKDINNINDLERYIEGIINDMDDGISTKKETKDLIADLVIKACNAVRNNKKISEI